MKKLSYIISAFLLLSCSQNEGIMEEEKVVNEPIYPLIEDGVVYPSTDMSGNATTRVSYDDTAVDWVNGTQVTLPDGQKVDLPWIDGGTLPFYS